MKRFLLLAGLALACVAGVPKDVQAGGPVWEVRIGSGYHGHGPVFDVRASSGYGYGHGDCRDSHGCGDRGCDRGHDRCDRGCDRRGDGWHSSCGDGHAAYRGASDGRYWVADSYRNDVCGYGRHGQPVYRQVFVPGHWEVAPVYASGYGYGASHGSGYGYGGSTSCRR